MGPDGSPNRLQYLAWHGTPRSECLEQRVGIRIWVRGNENNE